MGFIHAIQVELRGDNNETFYGTLTLESAVIVNDTGHAGNDTDDASLRDLEADPIGASTYVIAVVLIYGLSIFFLIGSQVVLRGRENYRDVEKQIDKFLRQAPLVKEKNAKDNYKNLKHSIIPVVALSSARDLVSRRKSFAAFIVGLHPPASASRRDGHDHKAGANDETESAGVSPVDEDAAGRMPTIEEEESMDELEKSQNSASYPCRPTFDKDSDIKREKILSQHRAHFYLGDTSGTNQSFTGTNVPQDGPLFLETPSIVNQANQQRRSSLPELVIAAPAVSDAWLESQRSRYNTPHVPLQETEQLLHVTCV